MFPECEGEEDLKANECLTGDVTRRSLFASMLGVAAALPMAGMFGPEAFAATPDAQSKGGGFYKIVSYEVPPDHWQEFLDACRMNAEASRKDRGVISFELLLPRDTASRMVAVEAYVNEDASRSHQQTAHFHVFADVAQRLGVTRAVVEAERYLPD
jgi:autoinducer 2-degrading protein